MGATGFWDDQGRAAAVTAEHARVTRRLSVLHELEAEVEELEAFEELAAEDEGIAAELEQRRSAATDRMAELEEERLFSGPYDAGGAVVSITAGAGGTDSQDWAEMLLRMYSRWGERHGFDVELLDQQEGEEAGIKSATLEVRGEYAYGYLRAERGVHRLVRISPFDSQARRHTSFASVFVYPSVDDTIEIEVREEDIEMDVFRASGAGGQHVNKTSSAVRLRHLPSGIVVECQQERSQHKNRATAMKMLKARLYQAALEEQEKEKAKLESTKTDIGFGSQIRSYVFQPYTMVNDHRTELKVADVGKVMDGDVDPFIQAYLREFGGEKQL